MRITRIIFMIILLVGVMILGSCKNTDRKLNNEITFDNEIVFRYDKKTNLTIKSFNGISTISDLNNTYPIFTVRKNDNEYYTIYSLKNDRLVYVLFLFSENTGVDFYVKEIIECSLSDEDKVPDFILEKDLPQNILKEETQGDGSVF